MPCFSCNIVNLIPYCSLSGRELERLDVQLLNRMPLLEVMNLSDNCLKSMPSNLELKMLKKLDCSENELSDISFLETLTSLRELNMDGNFLDVSSV